MARKSRKMTETELKALLAAEEKAAVGQWYSDLSSQREKALKYYLGEKRGNEMEGRSQVRSTEVSDTVEWIMPSLLKIFTGGDDVVTFEPQGREDEEHAKQATDYVNYVFMRDNPGFIILYTAFKDALLQKNGVCKVYWEEIKETKPATVSNMPDDAWALAVAEADANKWEIRDHETSEIPMIDGNLAAMPMVMHSATIMKEMKKGKVCVEAVPPEEFLISRRAKTIGEASFVAHQTRKTQSELIDAGYPRDVIEGLPDDRERNDTPEEMARTGDIDEDYGQGETPNRAMREIKVTEAYVRIDWDGDGVAELRKVTYAGTEASTILDNEAWDGPAPFITLTPVILPHRFYGRSIADLVMDLDDIKTTLWRQILDNLYLTNNPMNYIDPRAVNIDDMLTRRPGGVVRPPHDGEFRPDAIIPQVVPFTAHQSFPMLEYVDTVRENRVGVTRYNQGLDADSLNKTARGITQIMTAAQQRIELIARVFAETGVKDLFGMILYWVRKYPDQGQRIIRLRGDFVEMDPTQWGEGDFDLTVNVGIGTNNKDQMLGHLTMLMQVMEKVIMYQGGTDGPLVDLDNVYEVMRKLVENMGFKNAEMFVTDPNDPEVQQKMAQKPPKPNPEMEKLKIEQAKVQTDDKKVQIEGQAKMADVQLRAKELELKGRDMALKERDSEAQRNLNMATQLSEEAQAVLNTPTGVGIVQAMQQVAQLLAQNSTSTAQAVENQSQITIQAVQAMLAQNQQQFMALMAQLAAPKTKQITLQKEGGQTVGATVVEG